MTKEIQHYDYFVIGAGSGGVRSARIAATHGAKTGIAEGSDLGGTCVNLGCVPKKIMSYAADQHMAYEDGPGYGWDANKPGFKWERLIENKDKEILRLNGAYQNTLDNAGVTIHRSFAKFIDDNTLDIGGQTITADNILIATGGRALKPNIPGGEHCLTSDDFFHMKHMPKNPIIIGGGYIAVEFAHILHGLGANVTLLYRGELFLRGFDEDIRTHLRGEMEKAGIKLMFNVGHNRIEKRGDVYAHICDDGEEICGDAIIAAVGRSPNTQNLGLENTEISMDKKGHIIVDKEYKTSVDHIYAVGDVTDTPKLTPVAIKEGHVLADRLFGKMAGRNVNYDNLATAVFSQPAIGTIGMSEERAREEGYEVDIYKSNFRAMKFILPGREERTLMKLVVDKKTDRVLGLHMCGLDAPEIVQGFAVAMNLGATKADFDRTMPIHPTSAEEFVTLR